MSIKDWKNHFIPKELWPKEREALKNALDWYRLPENSDIRSEYPLDSFPTFKNFIYSIEWIKNKKAYLMAKNDSNSYDTVFENEKLVVVCPLNPSAAHKAAHYLFSEPSDDEYQSDTENELVDNFHNKGWGGNTSPSWCIAASDLGAKYWKDYHLYENHLTYFIYFKEKRYHGLRYALVFNAEEYESFLNGYDISEDYIIREFRDPKQHRGHGSHANYLEDYEAFLSEAGMSDEEFSEIIREYGNENNFPLKNAQRPEHQFDIEYWKNKIFYIFDNLDDDDELKEIFVDIDFYDREVDKMRDTVLDIESEEITGEEYDNLTSDLEGQYPYLADDLDAALDYVVEYEPQKEYWELVEKSIKVALKTKNKNIFNGSLSFLYYLLYNRYRNSLVIKDDELEKYSLLFKKAALKTGDYSLFAVLKPDDKNTKVLHNIFYFYYLKSILHNEKENHDAIRKCLERLKDSPKTLKRIYDEIIKGDYDVKASLVILNRLFSSEERKTKEEISDFLEPIRKENHHLWMKFNEVIYTKKDSPQFRNYLISVYENGDIDIFDNEKLQKEFEKNTIGKKESFLNIDKVKWGAYFINNLIYDLNLKPFDKKILPSEGIKYAMIDYGKDNYLGNFLNYFVSHPLPNVPMTWKEAVNKVEYTDEFLLIFSFYYAINVVKTHEYNKKLIEKLKAFYPKKRDTIINYVCNTMAKASKRWELPENKEYLIKRTDKDFDYSET